jgi:hypothetical protein
MTGGVLHVATARASLARTGVAAHTSGRMRLTSSRWGFERDEAVTTCAAFVVSTLLYLRDRHDYLPRGVLGDLIGFALLAAVLVVDRRRLRHEALLCLAVIGLVLAACPQWPLRLSSTAWWLIFAVGLCAYVAARWRRLRTAR